MAKFLDNTGLSYLWGKIKEQFVAKETGKGLSTNDFTSELKTKLEGVETGAQKNVKPDWNATAGNAAEILNKPAIPSKTSDLTNDAGFITQDQVPEGAVASSTSPKMDGTAAVGVENAFARGDHVHPSDTKKVNKSGDTMTGNLNMGSHKVTGLADPTANTDAAHKKYVDDGLNQKAASDHNHDDAYLKLSGGTMTGPIVFSADQGEIKKTTDTAEAKIEIDEQAVEILFKDVTSGKNNRMTVSAAGTEIVVGETTPGDGTGTKITVDETNGVKIPMVATPTADRDAANKKYVDDGLAGKAPSDHNHDTSYYKKSEVYTKAEVDGKGFLVASDIANKADKATTLAGYGISDAYTKTETNSQIDTKIANKANKSTTLSGYGITDAYTKTETYSKSEVDGKLSAVYKPAGNSTFANLPTPSASNLGNVYSMTEAFTTDERFIASVPTEYPIGTNVVVVQVDDAYYFDVLAGFIDLSNYMEFSDMVAITTQEIDELIAS